MTKTRKFRKSFIKTIKKTTKNTLPLLNNGLKNVGTATKNIVKTSIPVVEKGVSTVYKTMATGINLGIKGAKTVSKEVLKKKNSKRHKTYKRNY